MMKKVIGLFLVWLCCPVIKAGEREMEMIIVRGADGAEEYGKRFDDQVKLWQDACAKGGVDCEIIGTQSKGEADAALLKGALNGRSKPQAKALWLVFIGHGTFDGREDKFNFRGPDAGSKEIAQWLAPLRQEVVVVQCASASGGWVQALKGENRVVITATKGPDEVFYAHFGEYMAAAVGGLAEADIDADQQVSLLEAWLYASHRVVDFYEKEGRIATEHSILDDNADGVPTRSEVFHGVEPDHVPKDRKADGGRARQLVLVLSADEQKLSPEARAQRDAIEAKIQELKKRRGDMQEGAFFAELETLLRALGKIY